MENNKKRMTAQEIYNELVNVEQITSIKGQIRFNLGDVSIVVKRKDVVGNILQEWLEGWLEARNIDFLPNPNTQMPPDILLNTDDLTKDWLEIKAFNYESSPAFDIADFKAFARELIEKPYHLDTDYLIFGYVMDTDTGDVIVKEVWLKKVWEITRPMEDWPITLQYKNGKVQKMRPGKWYASSSKAKMFDRLTAYLSAFEETVFQNPDTRDQSAHWKKDFIKSYKEHYGKDIDFPRWNDIKDDYKK